MRTNKKPLLLAVVLAAILIGGGLAFFGSEKPNAAHHEEDADKHAHDEHKDDHAESGEHGHGDADEHAHGKDEHDHGSGGEEAHGDAAQISDESAKAMGIETVAADPASIRETVRLSGRMVLNQNRSAEVKARFPGVVRSVLKQVGDSVKKGEKLATVESNESLQVYSVPSPLDGVVLELNVSVGDTTRGA